MNNHKKWQENGVKVISESLDYCSYKSDAAYDHTLWKKIFEQNDWSIFPSFYR